MEKGNENKNENINKFTNILFIDKSVEEYQLFVDSANDTTFPIVYEQQNSKKEILELIQINFTKINRIAFVFHGEPNYIFLDEQPLFISNETVPFSENVAFIIDLIKKYEIQNIDYLACNTLKYPNWVDYYSLLQDNTNVIVGASDDYTGNIKYGGDWIMENTNEDIEFIYFTKSIDYYRHLLYFDSQGSFILLNNNEIYLVGHNSDGQFGLDEKSYELIYTVTTPRKVIGLPTDKTPYSINIATISESTIILMNDGTFYGAGANLSAFGTANSTSSRKFIPIMTTKPSGKVPLNVYCGSACTFIIMTDRTVYVCGSYSYGNFGLGDNYTTGALQSLTQIPMPTGKTPANIFCGISHTCIIMTDGTIFVCGDNRDGRLGLGTTTETYYSWQEMNLNGKKAYTMACGGSYTIVLMTDGTLFACGDNSRGAFGNGTTSSSTSLIEITTIPATKKPSSVYSGNAATFVLTTDGTIFVTGVNTDGNLGLGSQSSYVSTFTAITNADFITDKKIPRSILALGDSATLVLMTDGTIYGCGDNFRGALGLGSSTSTRVTTFKQAMKLTSTTYIDNAALLVNSLPFTAANYPAYTFFYFTENKGTSYINNSIGFTYSPTESTPTSFAYYANITRIDTIDLPGTLNKVSIGSNVTTIGNNAFANCSNLATINIGYTYTPGNFTVGTNAFSGISTSLTIQGTTIGCIIPNGTSSTTGMFTSLSTTTTTITISNLANTSITTIGDYAFNGRTGITTLTIPNTVSTIGASAFNGCTGLTTFTIPSSVTTIGASAFNACSNLATINLEYSGTSTPTPTITVNTDAFSGISTSLTIQGTSGTSVIPNGTSSTAGMFTSLSTTTTTITISNPANTSITTIGDYAFNGRTGITTLTIPDTVSTIGTSAFNGCTGLTTFTIPASVTSIGASAFNGCTNLATIKLGYTSTSTTVTINTGAFSGISTSLTIQGTSGTSVIPNGTSSTAGMFTSLSTTTTTITISNPANTSITTIGDYAFNGRTGITTLTIPDTVSTIGTSAFNGCTGLTTFTIPSSVTTIGASAFNACSNLATIKLGYTSTSTTVTVNTGAFSGISTSLTIQGTSGTSVIPNSTSSTAGMFTSLSTTTTIITISNPANTSITTIGDYAFNGRTGITTLTIPDTVSTIGTSAFNGCTGLTTFTIPSSVTTIGASAFNACSNLATIKLGYTSTSTTVTVNSNAFSGIKSGLTIQGTTTDCLIPNNMFNSLSTANTTVTISNPANTSIITIGTNAFSGTSSTVNTSIITLTIPSSVTTIGTSAFQYCSNLATINLGYTSTSTTVTVNSNAFSGIKSGITIQGTTTGCIIPNGATTNRGMFSSLSTTSTTVTIASTTTPTATSITAIGDYAFYGGTVITSVTIPTTVASIGTSSFNGCTGITSLTIPSSVTTIGTSAFNSCSNLATIILGYTSTSTTVTVNSSAFSGIKAGITIQGTTTNCVIPNNMFKTLSTTSTTVTIASTTTPTATSIITIGENAFSGTSSASPNTSITNVTIPSSVTTIGANAFQYCSNLATINIGYTSVSTTVNVGSSAFSGVSASLTIRGTSGDYVIPNGADENKGMFISLSTVGTTVTLASLTTIGNYAFYGRTTITSVTIPSSVIMIGTSSFNGCTGLTSLTIPSSVTTFGTSAFQGCTSLPSVTIPSSVISIGASTFKDCSNLTTIILGYTSTPASFSVGSNAFSGINASVRIQGDLSSCLIPNGASYATGMFISLSTASTTVTLANLTTIGNYAFSGTSIASPNTSIITVTIPSSVTTIGTNAFQYCSNLATIYLEYTGTPTPTITVNSNAFSNIKAGLTIRGTTSSCVIPNTSTTAGVFSSLSTADTTVTLASLTTIGNNAFNGSTVLTSITIPSSVATIGQNACKGCTSLTSITMSAENTITTVGTDAFAGCNNFLIDTDRIPQSMFNGVTSLTKVYFTNNITSISTSAFNGCTGLTYINLANVNTIGNSAFNGCTALKNVVSYPSSLSLGANAFSLVNITDATIYTNAPTTQYLNLYFKIVVGETRNDPNIQNIPSKYVNNSLYNIVSLYGNTYYISDSVHNELYGIPQSRDSSKLNYNVSLLPGLQYIIYNKSGIPQYIQFYAYCNCTNSETTGASVSGVFTISNNICTIQPNCVICFIYVGYTDSVTNEGYITGYANNII